MSRWTIFDAIGVHGEQSAPPTRLWGYLRWSEKLLQHHVHATEDLGHEEVFASLVEGGLVALIPALGRGQAEAGLRGSHWGCCADCRGREVCG